MHGALKRVALRALTQDAIAALFEPLTRGHAAIFYLHRFAESSAGLARHEPAHLRATLSYLRRRRFSVLPLTTLLERLAAGAPVRKALAFTVDDGYEDFHSQAAPVFAEFDCPVTVFLTTGFLDGQLWLWWDRVEYAFNRTTRRSVALDWGGRVRTFGWDGAEGAEACRLEIDEFLKSMRYGERLAAIDKLAEQLGVPLPASPPPEYAPMSWDAVRADARRGVTFGPHSVTHPILARVDAQRSGWEIEQSWNRVRAETDACVPVFCYPNGDPGSFGEREIATVRQLGLRAALTTIEGYATAQLFRRERPNARYAIPRFSYPETAPHFIQVVSGIERARSVVPVAIPRASRLDSEPVVLMVAYHFAPDNASGTHRSLHFARSLDLAGHTPCVLTTSLDALRSVDPALNDLFPFPERVLRVKPAGTLGDGYRALKDWWQRHAGRTRQPRGVTAANTSEPPNSHLSSVRRHLRTWDGFPDSHRAWYRPAVQAGMELRARHSVVAVYASGPPWTGLRVGATLARRFGCPFVADFRDPWTVQIGQNVVYDAKWAESMAARWERRIVGGARLVLCNTPAMERSLREHYDGLEHAPVLSILNGSDAPRRERASPFPANAPLRILHLGSLYRGRSVAPVTDALEALLEAQLLTEKELALELVGSGGEPPAPASDAGSAPCLRWTTRPAVPFHEAVPVMMSPCLLLVVQPPHFDRQIPTKLYDYLCTGNPVLVLAEEESASWGLARRYARCRRLDHRDIEHNVGVLRTLVAAWRSGALTQERTVEDTAMLTKRAVGEQFVRAIEGVLR